MKHMIPSSSSRIALSLLASLLLAGPAFGKKLSAEAKEQRLQNARLELLAHIEEAGKGDGLLVRPEDAKENFLAVLPAHQDHQSFLGIAWKKRDEKMSRFTPSPLLILQLRSAHPDSAMPNNVQVVDEYANPRAVLEYLRNPKGSYDFSSDETESDRQAQREIEKEIIALLKPHSQRMSDVMCRRFFTRP